MKLPKIIKLPVSNTQTECYFTITLSLIFIAESIDFIGFFMVGSLEKVKNQTGRKRTIFGL